jgi:hypothetical protein
VDRADDDEDLERSSRIPDAMLARIECLAGMTFDEQMQWIGEMIAALEKAQAEEFAAVDPRAGTYAKLAGNAFGEIVAVRLKCLMDLRARLLEEQADARRRISERR